MRHYRACATAHCTRPAGKGGVQCYRCELLGVPELRSDTPAVVEPLTWPYVAQCIACGTEAEYRLTDEQARLFAAAGIAPCFRCRGFRLLQRSDMGQVGSPPTDRPIHESLKPWRTVPRHVVGHVGQ